MIQFKNSEIKESAEIDVFYTSTMLKNDILSRKIKLDVKNSGFVSAENVKAMIIFKIPSGLTLAQIDILPEMHYKVDLLADGKASIMINVPKIHPGGSRFIVSKIYFAGILTAPEYTLDTMAHLILDDKKCSTRMTQEKLIMK